MLDNEHVHAVHANDAARRQFLKKSSAAAASLALGTTALPALASVYAPPVRKHGSTVRNVRNYGAVGDGAHDDTTGIQRAIDSLPSSGGTVFVPAGTYLIDVTRTIRLRSYTHLQLDPGAKLLAKATSASRYYVINAYKVHDVEISGGQIVGERDRHLGTMGQWGHCIGIRGCTRVTVRDIRLSKGWGDGISIGAANGTTTVLSENIAVANIVSTGNRRQGMTIGRCRNVKVYDSEFSYTSGIKPGCGIDIEPDPFGTSLTDTVRIENCWIHHNAGNGVQVYKTVRDVVVKACTIEYNKGFGVLMLRANTGYVVNCRIYHNRLYGVSARDATRYYQISSNTFRNNKTLYFGVKSSTGSLTTITGTGSSGSMKSSWQLEVESDCYGIKVGANYYAL
ncbi:right-handed parallel beta-helix repeat-containing protein [Lysobacter yangpyeongensis]|uniref:Right-handed parallel beta-helix repeat-containing protein n=1 Tax=Lysobacter yangpyeongensis TaxID=346182 RepID=A0ABW0SJC9_9GAMM